MNVTWHADEMMRKNRRGKTINKSTKETYEKNILHLVEVSEVLIKPGNADICPNTVGYQLVHDCSERAYSLEFY